MPILSSVRADGPQARAWLACFLPGLGEGAHEHLLLPPLVLDPTDGQGAHLLGLALSRAWARTTMTTGRGARMPESPRIDGVSLPEELGAPIRVHGWTPETGEVTVEVPPDHPQYALLLEGSTRGLSLPPEVGRLADLIAPDKINPSENVQVAPEPAGNFRRSSPPEENPVDEDDYTPPAVTVSLRVTVPADEVAPVIARLSAQLGALITEGGEGGAALSFSSVSLDAYLAEQDGGEE